LIGHRKLFFKKGERRMNWKYLLVVLLAYVGFAIGVSVLGPENAPALQHKGLLLVFLSGILVGPAFTKAIPIKS